jgi:cytochrome c oxidase accessory protein FixG
MSPSLLAPWRRAVQWLVSLAALSLPFIRVGGESLIRLDGPTRTLLFFGTRLRIEEFYLLLIFSLIAVLGFLFVTMVFGRVWCGWLCPQTTLSDLCDYLERLLRGLPAWLATLCRHLLYLLLAFVTGANLVWYFIAPADFFRRLAACAIGPVAGITLAVVAVLVYLDLALIRRLFCKTVCPYGRIQLMAMDRNTLTLEYDQADAGRCLKCGACVRICPMGIDIRNGLQVECINCGRCIDACRQVMAPRQMDGLIHYTFGTRLFGGGRPFNVRSLLLAATICLLTGLLVYGSLSRSPATIKVQRNPFIQTRLLPDGEVANFYTAYLENRTTQPATFAIVVRSEIGDTPELGGTVTGIRIQPNENRRIDFLVRMALSDKPRRYLILDLMQGTTRVATAKVVFLAR